MIDLLQAASEELILAAIGKEKRSEKNHGSAPTKKIKKKARRASAKVPKRRSKTRARKKT